MSLHLTQSTDLSPGRNGHYGEPCSKGVADSATRHSILKIGNGIDRLPTGVGHGRWWVVQAPPPKIEHHNEGQHTIQCDLTE